LLGGSSNQDSRTKLAIQVICLFASLQHFNSQMAPLKSRLMSDYPWSPRWEPLQMAERI